MTESLVGSKYPPEAVEAAIAATTTGTPTSAQILVLNGTDDPDAPKTSVDWPHHISRDLAEQSTTAYLHAHVDLIIRRSSQAAGGNDALLDIIVDGLDPLHGFDDSDDPQFPESVLESLIKPTWPDSPMIFPATLQDMLRERHPRVFIEAALGAYPVDDLHIAIVRHHLKRTRQKRYDSLVWLLARYQEHGHTPSLRDCHSSPEEVLGLAYNYVSQHPHGPR